MGGLDYDIRNRNAKWAREDRIDAEKALARKKADELRIQQEIEEIKWLSKWGDIVWFLFVSLMAILNFIFLK